MTPNMNEEGDMADSLKEGMAGRWHGLRRPRFLIVLGAVGVLGVSVAVSTASLASTSPVRYTVATPPVPATVPAKDYPAASTSTPIKHLVVIFDENVSFDHYFGTYPNAANTDGSPFTAKPGTPSVRGLTPHLLLHNPNGYNPERLSHSEALTCDQNHGYTPEEEAFDGGLMDKFVQYTQVDTCSPPLYEAPGLVMDYYDGNTVTALWNYAQNYAMSDNNYDTNFGPSTPGALNLASGDDGGGFAVNPTTGVEESDPGSIGSPNAEGVGTIYGDMDPAFDDCADSSHTSTNPVGVMTGQNIGDLLNTKHITWGWFQGGFAPTSTSNGYEVCGSSHDNIGGIAVQDYVPHHDPFQFYASTANPKHLPPTSEAAIGRTDQANHQYDLSDFYTTLTSGNMPAVSFLKPPAYENGHPGYSDPLDEQTFLVNTINQIEQSPDWRSTAIVITYDDSDGWYDSKNGPKVNGSDDPTLDSTVCTVAPVRTSFGEDRCGYGPRLPLVVISPYTVPNSVSHNITDQSSIIKFIEENWLGGERIGDGSFDLMAGKLDAPGGVLNFSVTPHYTPVLLDPTTGEVTSSGPRK
ncbi:MAG: alkaline phosphatase family protein [Streptosporangiaceae bacterium]